MGKKERKSEGHKIAGYMQNVEENLREGTPLNYLLSGKKHKEVKEDG
jgi:hypothetical protein